MINIIILLIIFVCLYMFHKKEQFSNIKDIILNNDDKHPDRQKLILNSSELINDKINNNEALIPYSQLYDYILRNNDKDSQNISRKGHDDSELPILTNNNYSKYIHKLKMVNNKLKIHQNFKIDLMLYHLNFILNTFKNVNELNVNKNNITDLKLIGTKLSEILDKINIQKDTSINYNSQPMTTQGKQYSYNNYIKQK